MDKHKMQMAEDVDGDPVFLGKTAWDVGYAQEKFPKVEFMNTKER
ncbi:MAG: hypothetical protein Q9M45_07310 [Robiginitomaculum sp.]|nr:hypothetical protein [Robiginitomaculum sp.]